MVNENIHNLVNSGLLKGKRIFSTNVSYKRFLKNNNRKSIISDSKPYGLWYAIGDSWLKWCISEEPGWIGKYIYEIKLNPQANILFIKNEESVFFFSKKYARKDNNSFFPKSIFINWGKVMKDYDGIEINPYFRKLRHNYNLMWYNGWDIPSGCIWNSNAKKRIILITELKLLEV